MAKSINIRRNDSAGFSLVELAIVLSVIAIIGAGVWQGIAYGWEYYRVQQAVQDTSLVTSNVRDNLSGQMGIPAQSASVFTNTLIATEVIPPFLQRRNNTGCNPGPRCADGPWGSNNNSASGTFLVCNWGLGLGFTSCASGPGPVSPYFSIEFSGLSDSSCMTLTGHLSDSSAPAGLGDVIINGTDLLTINAAIQPVQGATVQKYCVAGPGANRVDFVYRFRVSAS